MLCNSFSAKGFNLLLKQNSPLYIPFTCTFSFHFIRRYVIIFRNIIRETLLTIYFYLIYIKSSLFPEKRRKNLSTDRVIIDKRNVDAQKKLATSNSMATREKELF